MRPVIGLPVCQQDGKQQFVTHTYLNAVTDSGGLPLLLPLLLNRPQPPLQLLQMLSRTIVPQRHSAA